MDSEEEPAIIVHRLLFPPMKFTEFDTGLYYYDATELTLNTPDPLTTQICCLLNTVTENLGMFTKREISGANDALSLHRKCGRPSPRDFTHILLNNFILDCPITIDDWKRALFLYGTDVATLKGRTARKRPQPSPHNASIGIPFPLLHFHSEIRLAIDFVHIQGFPFIYTISREWDTGHYVASRTVQIKSYTRPSPN